MKEFYHKDLFGEEIDLDLSEEEEVDKQIGPKERPNFNIFTLTDAFGARKRKDSWILYQKALMAGFSPEEIFFKLVWQTKSILLASKTNNSADADMNPFPYSKAKSFSRNFKQGELEKLSEDLVIGYNNAHRGKGDTETMVEKLILKL